MVPLLHPRQLGNQVPAQTDLAAIERRLLKTGPPPPRIFHERTVGDGRKCKALRNCWNRDVKIVERTSSRPGRHDERPRCEQPRPAFRKRLDDRPESARR